MSRSWSFGTLMLKLYRQVLVVFLAAPGKSYLLVGLTRYLKVARQVGRGTVRQNRRVFKPLPSHRRAPPPLVPIVRYMLMLVLPFIKSRRTPYPCTVPLVLLLTTTVDNYAKTGSTPRILFKVRRFHLIVPRGLRGTRYDACTSL